MGHKKNDTVDISIIVDEVKAMVTKIKLFNTMKQLQQIHVIRNGKDSTVPIRGQQMATILSSEMTDDIRMRITKGLLIKK